MKQKLKLLPALIALLAGMPLAAQESETPIITFKTTLYENAGAENAFHFYIGAKTKTYVDVDFGFGPIETEVDVANFSSTEGGIVGTTVTGSVGPDGTVKVYGDPLMIDYLDLEGVYITDLDISALTNLEILNLDHNELKALDLTPQTKLQALYISDNPFGTTPLIVGANKPDLTILEMNILGAVDPDFEISGYPSLLSFSCYSTPSIKKVTPAACPDLIQLSIDATSVSTVDVSQNPKLRILNVGETPINNIDVTNNPALTELYCQHAGNSWTQYKINALNLSKNPNLTRLMCQGNNLNEIDLSNNPNLVSLYVNGNNLTSIDISKNPYLADVNVSNNYMDFNTIPVPRETFTEYTYYQHDFPVDRSYAVGTTLDFASRVVRPDSETWYALFSRKYSSAGIPEDTELDPEEYFSVEEGKVTLLKEVPDSVYLAFANSLYPEYDLHTSLFMIKSEAEFGKDNVAVSMRPRPATKTITLSVGMQGATPENPKKFSVDFGDGKPVEFTTTTSGLPAEANATAAKAGNIIIIYTPEGEEMSALAMDNMGLITLDVTAAHCLTDLSVTNCNLPQIDLSWNRCLTNLDLSGNSLTTLALEGVYESYSKTMIQSIKASNNKLTALTPGLRPATYVDLSNNQFETINLEKAAELQYLDLSGNVLTEINLQDLESIKTLNLSNNNLAEIVVQDYVTPDLLDLSLNRFPLSTLPASTGAKTYVYAPQKQWTLPEEAPTANLRKQLLDDKTEFAWFKADGTPIEGDGIKQNAPGIFQLLDTSLGKIYCTFTNPAFPDLTGENVYRTTDVEVAEMPTNVVFSMKTLQSGTGSFGLTATEDNQSLYIDWAGNGALEQYVIGKKLQTFEIQTVADADVKIYTYQPDSHITVFSLAAGPLEYFDASKLTELIHFTVSGSNLPADKMTLPPSDLKELVIIGSQLDSTEPLKNYPNAKMVNLSENNLTELDLSYFPKATFVYAPHNKISSVKFENPALISLAIEFNEIENIDFTGAPALQQLWISYNKLHSLDISMLPVLNWLIIENNYFDFNTLPESRETFKRYSYNPQYPIEATVTDDHIVDLSGYGATTFRWFIDTPYYDTDGGLVGEELYVNDEYTLENGVTTFLKNFTHIMCVMNNPKFPALNLYTNFIDVRVETSISEVESPESAPRGVYDLQGRPVQNPGRGLYIVNGRLEMLR